MALLTMIMQQQNGQQAGQPQQLPAPQQINGQTAGAAPPSINSILPMLMQAYQQQSAPAQQQQQQAQQQQAQQQQQQNPLNMIQMILSKLGGKLG
jgi:general secretion pathway protein N